MNIPVRMRRMRKNVGIRRLMEETSLEPRHLVQPYFVVPGNGILNEVKPGYGLSPSGSVARIGAQRKCGAGLAQSPRLSLPLKPSYGLRTGFPHSRE